MRGNEVINYVELFKFALDFIGVKRVVMPVPKKTFKLLLPIFSLMPKPIMTLDQYYMLDKDNVCSGKYKGVKDLLGFIRDWKKDF
jgi:NADH dehydrogenase